MCADADHRIGEWRKLMAMQAHRGKLGLKRNSADHPERSAETRNTPFVIFVLPMDQKVASSRRFRQRCSAASTTPTPARWRHALYHAGPATLLQASFVMECMDESGGAHLYCILFFDGACKPSFELIESKAQHLVIMPTAELCRNVCSTPPRSRSRARREYDWGVDLFHDVTVDVWTVVKAIYAQERPLHIYRKLAKERAQQPEGGPEMLKFCLTMLHHDGGPLQVEPRRR